MAYNPKDYEKVITTYGGVQRGDQVSMTRSTPLFIDHVEWDGTRSLFRWVYLPESVTNIKKSTWMPAKAATSRIDVQRKKLRAQLAEGRPACRECNGTGEIDGTPCFWCAVPAGRS